VLAGRPRAAGVAVRISLLTEGVLVDAALIAASVAAVANVGSLLVVAWQVKGLARQTGEMARQTQETAEASRTAVYSNRQDAMMRIDELFVQHPELRGRFYGSTTGDSAEEHRVAAVAELLLDLMDSMFCNAVTLPDELDEPWRVYFRYLVRTSEPIRDFWAAHRDWYGPELREFLDVEFVKNAAPHRGERNGRRSDGAGPAPEEPVRVE
jgi:hypothetical protein